MCCRGGTSCSLNIGTAGVGICRHSTLSNRNAGDTRSLLFQAPSHRSLNFVMRNRDERWRKDGAGCCFLTALEMCICELRNLQSLISRIKKIQSTNPDITGQGLNISLILAGFKQKKNKQTIVSTFALFFINDL